MPYANLIIRNTGRIPRWLYAQKYPTTATGRNKRMAFGVKFCHFVGYIMAICPAAHKGGWVGDACASAGRLAATKKLNVVTEESQLKLGEKCTVELFFLRSDISLLQQRHTRWTFGVCAITSGRFMCSVKAARKALKAKEAAKLTNTQCRWQVTLYFKIGNLLEGKWNVTLASPVV